MSFELRTPQKNCAVEIPLGPYRGIPILPPCGLKELRATDLLISLLLIYNIRKHGLHVNSRFTKIGLGASMPRVDVADFMLRLAPSDEYGGEGPTCPPERPIR